MLCMVPLHTLMQAGITANCTQNWRLQIATYTMFFLALLLCQSSTSPVTAMVLLTQYAHLAVVVLQAVRKGWDWRRTLSFTN